jgi:hypothetical protein
VNEPIEVALALSAGLALLGVWTGALQVRGLRRLAARTHVPSDEYAFLRGRHRRRLLIAAVFILAGAMIAGAYLSGMEARATEIGNRRHADPDPDAPKQPVSEEDRQFVRLWGLYWIAVFGLGFVLLALALVESWAVQRYWFAQFRQLRDDHQTKLRRDLAVYRTQKHDRRGGYGGRLGGSEET